MLCGLWGRCVGYGVGGVGYGVGVVWAKGLGTVEPIILEW